MDIGATIRSRRERRGHVMVARTGVGVASRFTPPDLWFAGDTGRARDVLLRAHPVITDGDLRVEQIGRHIRYASGEWQRWWATRSRVQLGAATFVDAAHVGERHDPGWRHDVDLGVGARVAVPGLPGLLRVDVAKGLRDGATAWSFIYEP
jgi:hypothetical protein